MVWIEYYPEKRYGMNDKNIIPERYESVEFVWHEDRAVKPIWKTLNPTMLELVKKLVSEK
jgi:hypothetical protein